ncbi:MAG: hypothetical protein ACLPUO_16715 [Streptosporangiaceae bacterium]|jgi:hypothetical protein
MFLVGASWLHAVSRRRRGILAEVETGPGNTLHVHEQREPGGVPAAAAREGPRSLGLTAGAVE